MLWGWDEIALSPKERPLPPLSKFSESAPVYDIALGSYAENIITFFHKYDLFHIFIITENYRWTAPEPLHDFHYLYPPNMQLETTAKELNWWFAVT